MYEGGKSNVMGGGGGIGQYSGQIPNSGKDSAENFLFILSGVLLKSYPSPDTGIESVGSEQ